MSMCSSCVKGLFHMEKLFTYGTLQVPEIQKSVFHRTTQGTPDALEGFEKHTMLFGAQPYPIIEAKPGSEVKGLVIEVTPEELEAIDSYETAAYRRISVTLKSGTPAWVYCR